MTRHEDRPDAGLNFIFGDFQPNGGGAVLVNALTQELVPHSVVTVLTSDGHHVVVDLPMEVLQWRKRRHGEIFHLLPACFKGTRRGNRRRRRCMKKAGVTSPHLSPRKEGSAAPPGLVEMPEDVALCGTDAESVALRAHARLLRSAVLVPGNRLKCDVERTSAARTRHVVKHSVRDTRVARPLLLDKEERSRLFSVRTFVCYVTACFVFIHS
jgi:hypothetical protein